MVLLHAFTLRRALLHRRPVSAVAAAAASGTAAALAATAAAATAQPAPAAAEEPPLIAASPQEPDWLKEELESGPGRYVAYTRRAVQVLLTKGRMVAYTSDVGEAMRPAVPGWVVRAAYGLTWMYVGCDVCYHTAEEHFKGGPPVLVARTAAHATTFQVIASVAVPSFLIHQVVHLTQFALKSAPPSIATRWLPSLVGLACIPLMPFIDEPIEHLIDEGFKQGWPVADAVAGLGPAAKQRAEYGIDLAGSLGLGKKKE